MGITGEALWVCVLGATVTIVACGGGDSEGAGTLPASGGFSGGTGGGNTGGAGGSSTGGAGGSGQDAAAPSCEGLSEATPRTFYLSADDSNSMASPAIARRIINDKSGLVPAGILRTFEFLNYYNVLADPAEPNDARVLAQASSAGANQLELQILVQAGPAPTTRRPRVVTLVLDTSGSMGGQPMEMEKAAIGAIASSLVAGDIVSAVSWDVGQSVVVEGHVVESPNDPGLLALASGLLPGGSTDLHSGLVAGYDLAAKYYDANRVNRVVLVSDGQANVGVTDQDLIGQAAKDESKEGIYLVGVGVGDGISDTLMNTVTDAGNGAYVYIDSAAEAQSIFGLRFNEVMLVAARDVQLEVSLPWYVKMEKFFGEQYSTIPGKVKPQHLAPGDSMVFQQLLTACGDNAFGQDEGIGWEVKWKEPVTYVERSASGNTTIGAMLSGATGELRRGRAIIAYAEALKAIPSSSLEERRARLEAARAEVAAALGDSQDPGLTEIANLLQRYQAIVAP